MKNIYKSIPLYTILLIITCFSCSHESKEFEISIDTIKGNNTLELSFSTFKDSDTLIVDMNAFYFCSYEFIALEDCKNINDISERITKSQFIIENNTGDYRLFSSFFILENESKDFPDYDCYPDEFQRFDLSKGVQQIIKKEISLSDIMVTNKDKHVKLWYIFKANAQQMKKGYRNKIIKSNWIKIPQRN